MGIFGLFPDFWLLWIMVLWASMCKFLGGSVFLFFLGTDLGAELLDHRMTLRLTFWGTARLFPTAAAPPYTPASSIWGFCFLYILENAPGGCSVPMVWNHSLPRFGLHTLSIKAQTYWFPRQASGSGSYTHTLWHAPVMWASGDKSWMRWRSALRRSMSSPGDVSWLFCGQEQRPLQVDASKGQVATRPPRGSHRWGQELVSLSSHSHPSILLSLLPLLTTFLCLPTACTPTSQFWLTSCSWCHVVPPCGISHGHLIAQSPSSSSDSPVGMGFCARPQKAMKGPLVHPAMARERSRGAEWERAFQPKWSGHTQPHQGRSAFNNWELESSG